MFDFLDEMVYENKPAVKKKSKTSNYLNPIEKAIDVVTRKAGSGKLTEKFPDTDTPLPVEKRPRYLAQALRKTRNTILRYNKIARRLV